MDISAVLPIAFITIIIIITVILCILYCKSPDQKYTLLTPNISTVATDLNNDCAICLENFNAGEQMQILQCKHYYHPECITPWLEKSTNKCPKCRVTNV